MGNAVPAREVCVCVVCVCVCVCVCCVLCACCVCVCYVCVVCVFMCVLCVCVHVCVQGHCERAFNHFNRAKEEAGRVLRHFPVLQTPLSVRHALIGCPYVTIEKCPCHY